MITLQFFLWKWMSISLSLPFWDQRLFYNFTRRYGPTIPPTYDKLIKAFHTNANLEINRLIAMTIISAMHGNAFITRCTEVTTFSIAGEDSCVLWLIDLATFNASRTARCIWTDWHLPFKAALDHLPLHAIRRGIFGTVVWVYPRHSIYQLFLSVAFQSVTINCANNIREEGHPRFVIMKNKHVFVKWKQYKFVQSHFNR